MDTTSKYQKANRWDTPGMDTTVRRNSSTENGMLGLENARTCVGWLLGVRDRVLVLIRGEGRDFSRLG